MEYDTNHYKLSVNAARLKGSIFCTHLGKTLIEIERGWSYEKDLYI